MDVQLAVAALEVAAPDTRLGLGAAPDVSLRHARFSRCERLRSREPSGSPHSISRPGTSPREVHDKSRVRLEEHRMLRSLILLASFLPLAGCGLGETAVSAAAGGASEAQQA